MALFGDQTRTRAGETVYDVWDGHVAVFCQIEDVEGVKNVEEIAKVPGGAYFPVSLGFSKPTRRWAS